MIEERNLVVELRDGVTLSVDVFRPDGGQNVPGLLAMSPYGKNAQSLAVPPQPFGFSPRNRSSVYNRGIEAGDPVYLTEHGYAHVIPDLRGIGESGGAYRGWCSPQEAEDGYDLVEWIAAQPWCDGNVGMVG
ncbi:MAG TPA: CocE/NonD family hydrolase, partial [Gaiellaceae bacterium]|nr:CocE/NonD family hydrolase [Gaiellaceae bacterium]